MQEFPPANPPNISSDTQPQNQTASRMYLKPAAPVWSRILLGLNIVVFVVMFLVGLTIFGTLNGPTDGRVLFVLGAKVNERILHCGEIWRLFSATFLHLGVIHLMVNLISLIALGNLVEAYFGHRRFLTIYFVAGIAGSLASYAISPNPVRRCIRCYLWSGRCIDCLLPPVPGRIWPRRSQHTAKHVGHDRSKSLFWI